MTSISSTSLDCSLGGRYLRCPLVATALVTMALFGFGIVDYDGLFVPLCLKVLLVDIRHLLMTLT